MNSERLVLSDKINLTIDEVHYPPSCTSLTILQSTSRQKELDDELSFSFFSSKYLTREVNKKINEKAKFFDCIVDKKSL